MLDLLLNREKIFEVSSPLHAAEPGVISVQQWMQPRFIGLEKACKQFRCVAI